VVQPWAADVVKAHAEKEVNNGPAPNPINQCRPSAVTRCACTVVAPIPKDHLINGIITNQKLQIADDGERSPE